jgi:NADH:ubiquinone oxidoreductase subunit F (NADH-binding)
MDKIREGKGSQHDLLTIEELGRLLGKASHCGLGESASKPPTTADWSSPNGRSLLKIR